MVERYSWTQRVLHWLMVALLVGAYAIGVYMTDVGFVHGARPGEADLADLLGAVHKLLGVALLPLALLRVGLRLALGTPTIPAFQERLLTFIVLAGQVGLYGLMIATPLLGWLALSAGGFLSLQPLAAGALPALTAEDPALYADLIEAHRICALALGLLVSAHVAIAALYLLRGLARGRSEFPRMWFGRQSS